MNDDQANQDWERRRKELYDSQAKERFYWKIGFAILVVFWVALYFTKWDLGHYLNPYPPSPSERLGQ